MEREYDYWREAEARVETYHSTGRLRAGRSVSVTGGVHTRCRNVQSKRGAPSRSGRSLRTKRLQEDMRVAWPASESPLVLCTPAHRVAEPAHKAPLWTTRLPTQPNAPQGDLPTLVASWIAECGETEAGLGSAKETESSTEAAGRELSVEKG